MSEVAPHRKRLPLPFVAIFIGLALGLGTGILLANRPTEQPYPYNHAAHIKAAECVLCHQDVESGTQAGLPDLVICTGCHATAPGEDPRQSDRELWAEALTGEAPPWNRIYRVPAHVFFSHRRHVRLAKIECSECHGDMKDQVVPAKFALEKLKMRNCIACHEEEQITVDCTACHR